MDINTYNTARKLSSDARSILRTLVTFQQKPDERSDADMACVARIGGRRFLSEKSKRHLGSLRQEVETIKQRASSITVTISEANVDTFADSVAIAKHCKEALRLANVFIETYNKIKAQVVVAKAA